jgi:hypothetical protein
MFRSESTLFPFPQTHEVKMRLEYRFFGAIAISLGLLQPALGDEPPVVAIVAKMADVTDELNRNVTGKPVQNEQKAIVHELDDLIASLEKQCQNCKNGMKRNNPTKGADESMISRGTGGIGTLINPNDTGKDWGKLSSRERDRILQSMSEGFPPEYRTVLERYYRRLAEEKGGASGAAAKAGDGDAAGEAVKETPKK